MYYITPGPDARNIGLMIREFSQRKIREEVMDTNKYLERFFPLQKPDFKKKRKDSAWFICDDRTMLVDETSTLKLCPNCYKVFFAENEGSDCCEECME